MVLNRPQIHPAVRERIASSARFGTEGGLRHLTFHAMGTHCRASFGTEPSVAAGFREELLQWAGWFESRYSRFIPESLIGEINSKAGKAWVELQSEDEQLFQLCHQMNFLSRGAFDPTALPSIRLWNWKAKPARIPSLEEIKAAQALVGWRKVQRKPGAIFLPEPGMEIDLGGIGKEFAVDMAAQLGLACGIKNLLIDFGQDIKAMGHPPNRPFWNIGLEDPAAAGKCWASLAVKDMAVATSGDYLRHFVHAGRRYGHIIDPRTGVPVDNGALSVSVMAPSCVLAGILSTSAFILGPVEGLRLLESSFGTEGCIVTAAKRFHTRRFVEFIPQTA
jgi:thiamine biosynthesis lipoprotein